MKAWASPSIIQAILMMLGAWRITSLFFRERGPFGIFLAFRTIAGIESDDAGMPIRIPDREIAQLLGCPWCLSIWIGLLLAVGWYLIPTITICLVLPFALSAMAVIIDRSISH